jgi:hypothetical protein
MDRAEGKTDVIRGRVGLGWDGSPPPPSEPPSLRTPSAPSRTRARAPAPAQRARAARHDRADLGERGGGRGIQIGNGTFNARSERRTEKRNVFDG